MKKCPLCKHQAVDLDNDGYWRCLDCKAYRKKGRLPSRVRLWAFDKSWIWRLPLVIVLAVILVRLIDNPMFALTGSWNPFAYFDLGMHELGHELFRPFGEFWLVAGGSLLQTLAPILWIIGFLQVRWYFASVLCLGWLGSSLVGTAVYAGDAFVQKLGLLSLGNIGSEEAQGHDWEYLFKATDNFRISTINSTSDLLRNTGFFLLGLSICLCLGLIVLIISQRNRTQAVESSD